MRLQSLKIKVGRWVWASVFIILLFSFLPVAGQEHTGNDLVKLYNQYEIECKNDSTFYEYNRLECEYTNYDVKRFNENKMFEVPKWYSIAVNDSICKIGYYVLKEPTFKGFIEFLREYGEGKKSE